MKELTSIDDLVEAPYNPRVISDSALDGLKESIGEFGDISGVVWNKRTGNLVCGHQRLRALRDRYERISIHFPDPHEGEGGPPVIMIHGIPNSMDYRFPIRVVDWPLEKEQAANLAANHPSIQGEWTDQLRAVMGDVKGHLPEVFDRLQFAELEQLIPDPPPVDGETDPDEVPEPVEAPVVKLHDLWALGEHRVLCGDSTSHDDVRRLCEPRPHLVVTSPPYNCDISYESHDDDMPVMEYVEFLRKVITEVVAVLEDGCFVAWNVGVTPKSRHFDHATILERSGLTFYRQVVWAKQGVAFPIWQYTDGRARKFHPNYCHELIYMFVKGTPKLGGPCEVDDEYSRDVWRIHQGQATIDIPGATNARRPTKPGVHGGFKEAAHPAAFPVGIPAGAIRHLTTRGEVVLDPFGGAGTTLIACQQLGRRALLLEIDPMYVQLALERWARFTGKEPVREDGVTFSQLKKGGDA